MSWYVGDLWKIVATITDPATETPVDPLTTAVTITTPKGDVSSVTPGKVETGVYRTAVDLTEAGGWHAVISTTGAYQAARPVSIRVLSD